MFWSCMVRIISGVFHEDTIKHRWDYVDVCFDMAGNLFCVFRAHLSSSVCQAPLFVSLFFCISEQSCFEPKMITRVSWVIFIQACVYTRPTQYSFNRSLFQQLWKTLSTSLLVIHEAGNEQGAESECNA